MNLDDTIVAIASAPGRQAARGIVRVSGPDAFDRLADVSSLSSSHGITRTVTGLRITAGSTRPLPCLVACYPAPHTYTGQPAVELLLPGNRTLLQLVVEAFIAAGARQAEPGEFTARAFFNGKLTLTEAEGVSATISAESDAQLRAAAMLRQGRLAQAAKTLTDDVASCLALIEAGIDFSDQEDVVAITRPDLHARITRVATSVSELLDRSIPSEKLAAVPSVVLVGPPNAGKSTLFNALLGRRRAVVSHLAGTTRDVLTEVLHLDPQNPFSPEIALSDLAGFDSTSSTAGLNQAMQQAAQKAVAAADLIVHLEPAGSPSAAMPPAGLTDAGRPPDHRLLHVRSKADLIHSHPALPAPMRDTLHVSVHDPHSVTQLRAAIAGRVSGLTATLSSDVLALLPRHEQTFLAARQVLTALADRIDPAASETPAAIADELIAADLRAALDALGQLNEHISPDDVLGRVFSQFCIGK